MGFLTADGSVSDKQLYLQLADKDKNHVLRFKNFIGLEQRKMRKVISTCRGKKFVGWIYSVSSKEFVASLRKHNLFRNKSFTTTIPDTIPKHLIHHYLRGLIDGDGCFYVSKRKTSGFNLISSIEMCKQVQEILVANCDLNYTKMTIMHYKGGNMAYLVYGGTNQVLRIADFLYKDATIYLERKRAIVDRMKVLAAERRRKITTYT